MSDYLTAFLLVNEVDGGGRPASGVGNINLLLQLDTDTAAQHQPTWPAHWVLPGIVNYQIITC